MLHKNNQVSSCAIFKLKSYVTAVRRILGYFLLSIDITQKLRKDPESLSVNRQECVVIKASASYEKLVILIKPLK